MSLAGSTAQSIQSYLNDAFSTYESTYGITPLSTATLTVRFKNIVTTSYKETGNKVAILIDEYDSPLQHSWMTAEHTNCTDVYRNVFAVLKACDEFEKFVFITGITKFTQISLFSVLNNLSNISFMPEYAAICGITEEEIKENFMPELKQMSEANNWSVQETHDRLKAYYDGYHYRAGNMVNIYNPYSLVNALKQRKIKNFWASSGATSLLPKFVDNAEHCMKNFEHCRIMRNTLELSDVSGGGAELFLYQSGYLTIKESDEFGYILGFPNEEVTQALYDMVRPALTLRAKSDIQSIQANLYAQLGTGQIDDAIKSLKALIADVPYSNKKLASMDMEERYRLIISTILNAIGLNVEVEKMISTGRIDMAVKTSRYIYVIELKLRNNGGKEAATEQILNRQYMEPFKADKRKVIGLGIELDEEGKGLLDWTRVE